MPKNQYNSPAMEVVEFGKEDMVCFNSWVVLGPDGKPTGNPDDSGNISGSVRPNLTRSAVRRNGK